MKKILLVDHLTQTKVNTSCLADVHDLTIADIWKLKVKSLHNEDGLIAKLVE